MTTTPSPGGGEATAGGPGEQTPRLGHATRHEVPDDDGGHLLARDSGWTDGLPVVLPTPARVAAMLDLAGLRPDRVVGLESVKSRVLTAEKVAANAVLAGCPPAAFPVVVAAVEAVCRPEFLLHGATSSTGGCALLVVVSGPVTTELGMSSGFSALSGADPVSVTVGRALRLVIRNLLGARPGELDRSTLGQPGKLSWCVADDAVGCAPWTPLGVDRGLPPGASSVTVLAAAPLRLIMNEWTTDPVELAETFAAEIRANMLTYSIWGGNYAIVVPPQLRSAFHDAGWSKDDLRSTIHQRARVERGQWETVGKQAVVSSRNRHRLHAALPAPDDLLIISAGGEAGGFGAVIPPWLGSRSAATTVRIADPAATPFGRRPD